jgi:acyl-CoA hydrolase
MKTTSENREAAPPSSQSTTARSQIADVVFPGDLNHHGTFFGGAALSLMSRAAFVAATRAARAQVVMAACDGVEFCSPVLVGDFVEATATVERVGRRSMTVAVDVVAEDLRTGQRRLALHGRFQMVALDEASSPGGPSLPTSPPDPIPEPRPQETSR